MSCKCFPNAEKMALRHGGARQKPSERDFVRAAVLMMGGNCLLLLRFFSLVRARLNIAASGGSSCALRQRFKPVSERCVRIDPTGSTLPFSAPKPDTNRRRGSELRKWGSVASGLEVRVQVPSQKSEETGNNQLISDEAVFGATPD